MRCQIISTLIVSVFMQSITLVCDSAEPDKKGTVAVDEHDGHAGVEGKLNRYTLKSRVPIKNRDDRIRNSSPSVRLPSSSTVSSASG